MKRQFYLETKAGRELGTVLADDQRNAIEVARASFTEPLNGWGTVRVFAQLLPSALHELSKASDEVRTHLKLHKSLDCPEGCARMARQAESAMEWALASAWWGAASGASIGHSRSAMYDECRLKCLRTMDPGYQPWNNIL